MYAQDDESNHNKSHIKQQLKLMSTFKSLVNDIFFSIGDLIINLQTWYFTELQYFQAQGLLQSLRATNSSKKVFFYKRDCIKVN